VSRGKNCPEFKRDHAKGSGVGVGPGVLVGPGVFVGMAATSGAPVVAMTSCGGLEGDAGQARRTGRGGRRGTREPGQAQKDAPVDGSMIHDVGILSALVRPAGDGKYLGALAAPVIEII